jgi:uncharacterized repeat protein (TIGR01451 family)
VGSSENVNLPCISGTYDAGGFSDGIYYGISQDHPYTSHEVLSGEWAAAVYYDNINTMIVDPNDPSGSRQAMWLTDSFKFPNWSTNSKFYIPGGQTPTASDSSSNPVTGCPDTAVSYIRDGKLEIRIDYEVADLEQASGSVKRSPLSFFTDPNNPNPMYVYSDRYVLLQTYTFRNLDPNTSLENLAFFQFLHSHGANEFGPRVNSCYSSVFVSDALASYIPYNSVHCAPGQTTAGDFRYDITQWNSRPYQTASHTDYVSFSSTRQPDWFDNDVYRGGHSYNTYIPPTGTHHHIENRQLNNVSAIYHDEVGGAMGWNLGTLDPNETTSLTIAFMCGYGEPDEADIALTKTDNLGTGQNVEPGDELVYTIGWTNEGQEAALNAELVDYLPRGVDYPARYWTIDPNTGAFIPPDTNYNATNHSYTWNLGTIPVNGSGSRSLTVVVNEAAEPGRYLHNDAVLTSSIGQAEATEDTPVACWDNDDGIIYVNMNAVGYNNGIDWTNAYTDLNMALDRAASGCCNVIYVAAGTYSPGRERDSTFEIPLGVSVYGGFPNSGGDFSRRDPKRYPTILTGIGGVQRKDTVVTMRDDSLLDGFTITDAAEYGVYGTGADFTIQKCIIENSDGYGVYSADGNVNIKWCKVAGNILHGVLHEGVGFTLNVENSWILRNGEYGIYTVNSTPIVKNSIISESDLAEKGRQGIRIVNPTLSPILHNNTVANNKAEGIFFTDNANASNDPNFRDYPDVQNCIVYYNNNGGSQFAGVNPDLVANFCCIQDCNTVNTNNFNDEPGFAYTVDPNGIPDPNNYHLSAGSACVDRGNPDPAMGYASQVDYDNEARQYGDRVDVGADEVYNCDDEYLSQADVYNALDWNADGMVNLTEFTKFSAAWLTYDATHPLCDPNTPGYVAEPNEPGYIGDKDKLRYNPQCDLDKDLHVGLSDFMLFCEDWLWVACWKLEEINAAAAQTESLSAQSLSSARSLSVYSLDASLESAKTQPEISAATLIQILEFLNSAAAEESDNAAGIEDIKAILLAELQGLQSTENQ